MATPKKKPKKPRVRHVVRVGDIVKFYSPLENYAGYMGEVVAVPNKKYCVVKSNGSRYEQYRKCLWVVLTQKPTGTDKRTGEKNATHQAWIKRVAFRKTEYLPEPPKPKIEPRVLRTPEELLEHLQDENMQPGKVIYLPDKDATGDDAA